MGITGHFAIKKLPANAPVGMEAVEVIAPLGPLITLKTLGAVVAKDKIERLIQTGDNKFVVREGEIAT